MRARRTATVLVGLAGLLLAASCTLPEGVDGDLVDQWEGMPEPAGFTPAAGVCHPVDHQENSTLAEYEPVDCDRPHQTETVHVGEFTGEAGERVTPPEAGSSVWRDAYQQCEEGAADYLGADFRRGPLWLGVTVPSVQAWEGGSRWLRCDVVELDPPLRAFVEREGSLAGGLSDSSELELGCFVATVEEETGVVEEMDPVACADPHDAEFVGVYRLSADSYPVEESEWEPIYTGCWERVAEFADVPADVVADLTGTIGWPMTEQDWDNGDRTFRCYLWLDEGREVSESLADAGADAFPSV